MFADGGMPGLHLQMPLGNGRSWVLRVTVGDLRRYIGLGRFRGMTLACACEKARDMIESGIDPI